jgi:hypothetical protein
VPVDDKNQPLEKECL